MKKYLLIFFYLSCSKDISVENPINPSDCDKQIVADAPADNLFQKKDSGCKLDE